MSKFVVDASVAAKWFVPEIYSDAATLLLNPAFSLYAPDLIAAELGNVLWKKVRRGEIESSDAAEILTAFSRMPIEMRPASVLVGAALELAVAIDRTVYDSLYLALAIAENCALITADAKFLAAAKASGAADHVRWVEDAIT